jgi:hypothetical protein
MTKKPLKVRDRKNDHNRNSWQARLFNVLAKLPNDFWNEDDNSDDLPKPR